MTAEAPNSASSSPSKRQKITIAVILVVAALLTAAWGLNAYINRDAPTSKDIAAEERAAQMRLEAAKTRLPRPHPRSKHQ